MSSFADLKKRRDARQPMNAGAVASGAKNHLDGSTGAEGRSETSGSHSAASVPTSAQDSASPASPAVTSAATASPPAADTSPPSSTSTVPKVTSSTVAPSPETLKATRRLSENGDIEVRWTEKRGRGLYWQPLDGRTCKKGTNLLQLKPTISILSSDKLRTHCSACFRALNDLSTSQSQSAAAAAGATLRCSSCKLLRYCGRECQRADWPDHKLECRALREYKQRRRKAQLDAETEAASAQDAQEKRAEAQAMQLASDAGTSTAVADEDEGQDPGADVRALARLLWSRARISEHEWQQVQAQHSTREAMAPEQLQEAGALASRFAFFRGCASTSAPEDAPGGSAGPTASSLQEHGFGTARELLDWVCKYSSNAFTAATGDLEPLGVSVCPTAALINNSCLPNAVVVFPWGAGASAPQSSSTARTRCLHVNALRDIAPGEEILTSYLDLSEPLYRREETLQRTYCFKCDCAMCRKARKAEKALAKALADGAPLDTAGLWQDPRDSARCQNQACQGWFALPRPSSSAQPGQTLRVVCQACRKPQSVDLSHLLALREDAIKQWAAAEAAFAVGNYSKAIDVLSSIIPPLRRVFTPASFPLFAGVRLFQLAAIDQATVGPQQQSYDLAIYASSLQVQGMQMADGLIFADGHPAKALALAALGRLAMSEASLSPDERRTTPHASREVLANHLGNEPALPNLPTDGIQGAQFARIHLLEAVKQLRIGFAGQGHAIDGVSEALADLERGLASAVGPF